MTVNLYFLNSIIGLLADLGFTYDEERGLYHHHGTEFGRRKADLEDVSLDKFANFLDVSIFLLSYPL